MPEMDEFDGLPPEDILAVVASSPSDGAIATVLSELDSAQTELAEIEADLAVGLVECLQECMEVNADCQHCLNGILDADLRGYNDLLYKLSQKVESLVQTELSSAISAGVDIGIPITDLILINGTPITTDGVPNVIPDNPQQTIGVSLCPEGQLPQVTPDNRIICVTPDTPTEPVDLPGVQIPGVIPPVTPFQPPPQPPSPIRPPVTQPPVTPPTLPPSTPSEIGYVCIQTPEGPSDMWTIDRVIATYPEFAGVSWERESYHETLPGVSYWRVSGDLPTGWGSGNFTSGGALGGVPFTCYQKVENPPPNGCPPCPPSTGGTGITGPIQSPPQAIHPFCDPDNLSIPDSGGFNSNPSVAVTNPLASTLGADLTTILTQPSGNDAMDALTNILGTPIVAAGYGIDFFVNGVVETTRIIGDAFSTGMGKIIEVVANVVNPYLKNGPCRDDAFYRTAAANFIPQFLSFFGGCVPTQVTVPNVYTMNYICPVLIPSGAELNGLRSKGLITDSQWRIGVRANNLCPEWQEKIVDGIRTVPTADQVQIAWRRGIIDDDAYDYYMERNGILRKEDANVFFKLTEFVPGPSDLVRFMVRDVFDESVVTSQQLDSQFTNKFTGRAKEWAADQGMTDDVFKYFWRSHWDYPSNTQLYQMLHRLREDKELPQGLGVARKVTAEDIKRVLQINDQSPEWIERLIAISYNVLTRVDARRAFEIGAIDANKLQEIYQDQGYSPEDAKILRDFAEMVSGPTRAKQSGNASSAEVLGWFKDQLIPRDQAYELLLRAGIVEKKANNYLDTAELRRVNAFRKQAVAALRKRYMHGEFTNNEAASQLRNVSVPSETIGELLTQWEIVRNAKYKSPTVGMLCDWWTRGYISIDDYKRRVTNLGYSLTDAERIIASCMGKEAERRKAEAEKLAKEADALERRRQSDLRRQQSDIRRIQKETAQRIKDAMPCTPPKKPTCPTPQNGQSAPQPQQ